MHHCRLVSARLFNVLLSIDNRVILAHSKISARCPHLIHWGAPATAALSDGEIIKIVDYPQTLHILYWLSVFWQLTLCHWFFHKSLACLIDWQITQVLIITNLYDQRTLKRSLTVVACVKRFVLCLYPRYAARHRLRNVCLKLSIIPPSHSCLLCLQCMSGVV